MPMNPYPSDSAVLRESFFSYGAFIAQDKDFCVCEPPAEYHHRNPEDNPLFGVISKQLETYLARQENANARFRALLKGNCGRF